MAPAESNSTVWNNELLKHPHDAADKRQRVQRMFAAIAPSYDLNNRLHSLWMDQRWRRRAVKLAELKAADQVIDVASGTGDLSIKFAEELFGWALPGRAAQIIGVDFTFSMLPIAQRKWARHGIVEHTREDPDSNPGAPEFVRYVNGDALALPLANGTADVISIAFGIRNV